MRKNILNDDNLYSDMLAELQAMLSEELEKPEGMRSFDTIAEITSAIAEISGGAVSDEKAASAADDITANIFADKKRNRITMITKYMSVISACAIMFIAFNFLSINSFGANLFDAIVSARDDGFSLDFHPLNGNSSAGPESPADNYTTGYATTTTPMGTTGFPYGTTATITEPQMVYNTTGSAYQTKELQTNATSEAVKAPATETQAAAPSVDQPTTAASGNNNQQNPVGTPDEPVVSDNMTIAEHLMKKCQYDFFTPCAPIEYDSVDPYIPLTDFSTEKMTDSDDYYFTFSDDEHQVDIIIERYFNPDDIPQLIIPMAEATYQRITGEVGEIFIFNKEDRMCAVFIYDNCVYTITGYNFDESFMDFAVSFRVPIQN